MRLFYLGLASVLGFGLTAGAQEAAEPEKQPAVCDSEPYHQFDFWLGTWTVTNMNGKEAGTNTISSEEGGCLILESWKSVNGNTGQSYNFYNPATDKWRQVWVSKGLIIDYEGGITEAGSMRLEGSVTYTDQVQTAPFTGEWTLNEDGTVTQHFEQFDAEEEEWVDWFTGVYTRTSSDAL